MTGEVCAAKLALGPTMVSGGCGGGAGSDSGVGCYVLRVRSRS